MAALASTLIFSCGGTSSPETSPSAPTIVPTITALNPLEPTPSPTRSPSPSLPPTPTPSAIPTLGPAEVIINKTQAKIDFPNSITFNLDASSALPIDKIALKYGTEQVYSCGRSYSTVDQKFGKGEDVKTSWTWEMKKSGSIPPGSTVWWQWQFTDEADRKHLTPRQELLFEDRRFDWQTASRGNYSINWYDGGVAFGTEVALAVDTELSRLQLGSQLEKPVKVFVYSNSTDVQGATLFTRAWVGGLAYVSYNIVLIAISPGDFDREISGLTHELAHLAVREVTFNCIGDLPTWLSEGLAMYAEGPLSSYHQDILDQATRSDKLISVRSLSSSFPAGHGGASLSDAQSYSLVKYLVETYGWKKMRMLLDVFREGSTPDKALKEVYDFDRNGLDRRWRRYVGG